MPQFHLYFLPALCFFTAGSTCNVPSTEILEPLPNTLNLFIGYLLYLNALIKPDWFLVGAAHTHISYITLPVKQQQEGVVWVEA